MKTEKQLSIFGKQKSTKVFQIFAFQKIASEIDAETPKGSFAPISHAIGPDCWIHYTSTTEFNDRPSRSHCIFSFQLKLTGKDGRIIRSILQIKIEKILLSDRKSF